jgi:acetyl-CoA C-acetyltransferase
MDIYIESAKRTPMGSFQGQLKNFTSVQLGAHVIQSVKPDYDVDDVIMGCVLSAGLGQAPARQAAIHGGLALSTHCTTVNKVCGSGLMAIMTGWMQIMSGQSKSAICGGMESMTNAPYLLDQARGGYKAGHKTIIDHMMFDGLEDAYPKKGIYDRTAMGVFADATAEKYGITREQQDQYAIECIQKANKGIADGWFKDEIAPLTLKDKTGEIILNIDEPPSKGKIDKIPTLKPAFGPNGTVTPASSSPLTDGAAALLLTATPKNPLAVIKGFGLHSHEPEWFTTAPIKAIQNLLANVGWSINDVDLFEINEAFAVVSMACIKELNIPGSKVNIAGGACALGHPIGASGARIVTTLIHNLKRTNQKKGVAALCIGGGEGIAIAIEIV